MSLPQSNVHQFQPRSLNAHSRIASMRCGSSGCADWPSSRSSPDSGRQAWRASPRCPAGRAHRAACRCERRSARHTSPSSPRPAGRGRHWASPSPRLAGERGDIELALPWVVDDAVLHAVQRVAGLDRGLVHQPQFLGRQDRRRVVADGVVLHEVPEESEVEVGAVVAGIAGNDAVVVARIALRRRQRLVASGRAAGRNRNSAGPRRTAPPRPAWQLPCSHAPHDHRPSRRWPRDGPRQTSGRRPCGRYRSRTTTSPARTRCAICA